MLALRFIARTKNEPGKDGSPSATDRSLQKE